MIIGEKSDSLSMTGQISNREMIWNQYSFGGKRNDKARNKG